MIKIVQTTYKDIKDFNNREWKAADREHYGKDVNWREKKLFFKASEGKNVIGSLKLFVERRC